MTRNEANHRYSPMLKKAFMRTHLVTLVFTISGMVFLFSGVGLLRRKRLARTIVTIILFLFAVYIVWYTGWRSHNVMRMVYKSSLITPMAMISLGTTVFFSLFFGITSIWAVGKLCSDAVKAEFAKRTKDKEKEGIEGD